MRRRPTFARLVPSILIALTIGAHASAQRPQPARSPARVPAIPAALAHRNVAASPNSSTPVVATPVISLPQGSYSGPQTVTVTDATPGVALYYSLDGDSSTTPYNGSITISKSGTLVVIAALSGYQSSTVWASYYITSVPDSFVYTVAGSGFVGYAGDGGLATQALVNFPKATATDSSGNLYIADNKNGVVRKVDASSGIITTIAGTGIWGYSGDNGPATSAQIAGPNSLAFDSSGNLYIGQGGDGVVRKVTMSTGVISTYAGNPNATTQGDGGLATNANLGFLYGIAMDSSNNLYVLASYTNIGVREVDANTKIITTVAGGGAGNPASGGPATSVSLPDPFGIAIDGSANIYIADYDALVIWKVTRSTGNISIFAGTDNTSGYTGDGGPATSATLYSPLGVAADTAGNIYIIDQSGDAIRKVDATTGDISTYAGNDPYCFSFAQDGSSASSSDICQATGLSVDGSGNLYYVDGDFDRVKKITATATPPSTATADPVFSVPSGTYSDPQTLTISDATPGASIYLYFYAESPYPYPINQNSIILGGDPSYYRSISIAGPATVIAVAVAPGYTPSNTVSASYNVTLPPQTTISTIAGNGQYSFTPVGGGLAIDTALGVPEQLALDKSGNLYFADANENVVWKVSSGSGVATIVAGTGKVGDTGDNGPATSATLRQPFGVAVDASGNIFIADTLNSEVREVLASNGNIVRFGGIGNVTPCTPQGDGGPATSACISEPEGIALDSAGNIYVTDGVSVRRIDASTGIISTYAGGGYLSTEGIPATSAMLEFPSAIAFDAKDNLYIADESGRVRVVSAQTKIITTVAGNGALGTSGDGLLATQAEVYPNGIAVDGSGNVYIGSDYEIRRVDAKTGIISSVAGIGYPGYNLNGGAASGVPVCPTLGLLFDPQSNLYFSAGCGGIVSKITFTAPAPAPTFDPPAGSYTGPQSVTISDTAPNVTIYFTTDGSTPGTNSTQYSGPVSVTASETLNAIAVASDYGQSPAGSAAYKIIITPTITWPAPAAIIYGTALSATQLDATSSVPGSFSYSPAAGTILAPATQTLKATFTPTDTTDYTSATASVTLVVNPVTPPSMISPSSGTQLGGATIFTWNPGAGPSGFQLYIGTSGAGSHDLYQGPDLAATVTSSSSINIPANGATLYVRLWYLVAASWQHQDYIYTEKSIPTLTSPSASTLISGPTVFTWNPGAGISAYQVYAGTTGTGSSNLYRGPDLPGTATSSSAVNIPGNGATVYVRLWYEKGTAWFPLDYVYTEATAPSITSPATSTLLGGATKFVWNPGTGVSEFQLYIGTAGAGSSNIYRGPDLSGTTTSSPSITIPANGATLYVRLWYVRANSWFSLDYTYTAATPPSMSTPAPGSTIGSPTTFSWNPGSGASNFQLYVGTTGAGSHNLYQGPDLAGTVTSSAPVNIPGNGATLYVRLWYLMNGSWLYQDYTYTKAP